MTLILVYPTLGIVRRWNTFSNPRCSVYYWLFRRRIRVRRDLLSSLLDICGTYINIHSVLSFISLWVRYFFPGGANLMWRGGERRHQGFAYAWAGMLEDATVLNRCATTRIKVDSARLRTQNRIIYRNSRSSVSPPHHLSPSICYS